MCFVHRFEVSEQTLLFTCKDMFAFLRVFQLCFTCFHLLFFYLFCTLWNLIWLDIAESLWSQLNRMSLSDTDAHHPVLGNIKQTMELLVQQR